MRTRYEKAVIRLKNTGSRIRRAFAALGAAFRSLAAVWLTVFAKPVVQRIQLPQPRLTSDDVDEDLPHWTYEWKNDAWPQPPLFTHRRTSYKIKIAARHKEDER